MIDNRDIGNYVEVVLNPLKLNVKSHLYTAIKKPDYKRMRRQHRKRQRKEFKRRRKKRERKEQRHERRLRQKKERRRRRAIDENDEQIVVAPVNFSMVHNTDEFVRFVNAIISYVKGGVNVFIDMDRVQAMTPEAVTVLVYVIDSVDYDDMTRVRGNLPDKRDFVDLLSEGGFFRYVNTNAYRSRGNGAGKIFERGDYQVESDKARRLLENANSLVPGDWDFHWDGIQGAIIECMNNTVEHASGSSDSRTKWWLSVYCDTERGVAHFTFVDDGVGIFESLGSKGLLGIFKSALGITEKPKVLHQLLKGEIASSTGLDYRGRGLPNIYKKQERGQLKNLTIVTNNVVGDAQMLKFSRLSENFSGTFLYWTHAVEGEE